LRALWEQERARTVLLLIAGVLLAIALVALSAASALVPLFLFEGGCPGPWRIVLGLVTAFGLVVASVALLRTRKAWMSLVKWRLLALARASPEGMTEQEEAEEEEGVWVDLSLAIRSPSHLLSPPIKSGTPKASTWPLIAFGVSALLALWIPSLHFHHDFFVALAQVIPVLMVAVFVEATALYRVYMPVLQRILVNESGAPTPPHFWTFRRYMKNILWLAVVGEIAALAALAAEVESGLIGSLASVSTLGVALALTSTFFERIHLDQFQRTRSPGGWDQAPDDN
jgi:hypothetical protein